MDRSAATPSWCRFDFTNPVVARSRALYDQNLILLEESYRRSALGRRLLNKAWGVEGAVDDGVQPSTNGNGVPWPPYELMCLVRDKITSGRMYMLPDAQCWIGPATGKVCVVCGVRIFGGAECEVGEPDSAVFAHLVCHSLWCQESRAQHREQDTAAS